MLFLIRLILGFYIMMEFIVLGQIPGTNTVLTFALVITIAIIAISVIIGRYEFKVHSTNSKRKQYDEINDIAL